MNRMAVSIGLTLIYIDDIVMKHHWHWDAQQHIDHLRKLFVYCEEKNMLLNPSKFFPFVTKCTSFGFERTLHGSRISPVYLQKIVAFKEPETLTQLREFIGVLGYVSRYIYNGAKIQYWLNQLLIGRGKKERGKIKLTKQAQIAFRQLKYLASQAPVLTNPTLDGEFMVKTDACITGIGAVLYQKQIDEKTNKPKWVIIDMYSKQMPPDYRKAHSTVHEALAIVYAFQHWQHYLIKREFIIYTDNRPVACVFTNEYEGLNPITQTQLIRLRIALAPFTFQIKHVKGVHNKIADGLSRQTMKIIKLFYPDEAPSFKLINDADHEWILFGKSIESKDTMYKPQTQEQIDEINRKAAEISRNIQILNKQINNNNFSYFINILNNNEKININNIFIPSNESHIRVSNKFDIITLASNSSYNETLSNFKHSQPFGVQQQVEQLLMSSNHEVLKNDEFTFNNNIIDNISLNMLTCIGELQHVNSSLLLKFAQQQEETLDSLYIKADVLFTKTQGKKLGCKHNTLKITVEQAKIKQSTLQPSNTKTTSQPSNNSHLPKQDSLMHAMPTQQTNDKESNPKITSQLPKMRSKGHNRHMVKVRKTIEKFKTKTKDPIEDDEMQQQATKMQLRSDSRKQHKQKAKRTDYLNEDFDELCDRRSIRNEFIYNLYGHRDPKLTDKSTFIERQKADTTLQLVRNIIAHCEDPTFPITRQNIATYTYFIINEKENIQLTQQQEDTNKIIDDFEFVQQLDSQIAIDIISNKLYVDKTTDLLKCKQDINGIIYHTWVVPGALKHKMLDYAHHNLNAHHPNWLQSFQNLHKDYWWSTMKTDMRKFVLRCLLCQFANGSLKNRAPLTQRQPVLPRESLFGDFIELKLANKPVYILVLIDYCTGWTMLIPSKTNDAYSVIDAIIRRWIPIHGMFKYFDSDQGSGFISRVIKLLMHGLNVDLQLAEPNYHRGIGKVERTIKMIQDTFQRINLQWDEVITDSLDPDFVFNTLSTIAPHIQAAINQRRPRISTFSPNMLMFGTQLKDIGNIDIVIERMRELFCDSDIKQYQQKLKKQNENKQRKKQRTNSYINHLQPPNSTVTTTTTKMQNNSQTNEKRKQDTGKHTALANQDSVMQKQKDQQFIPIKDRIKTNPISNKKDKIHYKYEDFVYLQRLLQHFKQIYQLYNTDYQKYLYETKQQYEKKYNITENSINRNNKIFTIGKKVLYFVGDKQIANKKWLRRFTGPWTITLVISDGTVIIEDPKTQIQKRVSINRLKIFKSSELNQYSQQFDTHEYDEYKNNLKNILFKIGSSDRKTRNKARGTQLDFRKTRFQQQINKNNSKRMNQTKRKINYK